MIRLFKIVTGETIVARCERAEEGYHLDLPLVIQITLGDHEAEMSSMPWLPTVEGFEAFLPHRFIIVTASEAEMDRNVLEFANEVWTKIETAPEQVQ